MLVVIPAYDEASVISSVIAGVSTELSADIVVVDDGSSDATIERARAAGALVLRHPCNLGIGAAVQTGFQFAVRAGYDAVVRVDGDGQHDPKKIPRLLQPILSDEADIVVGSRFLARRGYQSTFARRGGILILSLVSAALGTRTTDPTSGFWALNRKAFSLLATAQPDDYPETEAMIIASRCGLRLREVPAPMRERGGGRSSIRGLLHSGFYMLKVLFAVLIQRTRARPVLPPRDDENPSKDTRP